MEKAGLTAEGIVKFAEGQWYLEQGIGKMVAVNGIKLITVAQHFSASVFN